LTIDPRIRRIGFALFDAAMLEDSGVKNVRSLTPAERVKRLLIPALIGMLDHFEPEVLIVPDARAGKVRRSKHVRQMIQAVVQEARERAITVHAITDAKVKKAFSRPKNRRPNKQKINHLLVEWFPELQASLPKARKLWESEQYFTPLFDAIARYCAWLGVPKRQRV
jgi:Holliday junction resolvasome RuvABC endonuclease subunit